MNINSPQYEEIPKQPFHDFVIDAYTKNMDHIVFTNAPEGISMKMPIPGIIEIESDLATSTEKLIIQCGVHGDERQGIIICNEILRNILNSKAPVARPVTIIYANPEAIALKQRTMEDGTNMNRVADKNNIPRVKNIIDAYDGADLFFDLHSSFNSPNLPFSISYVDPSNGDFSLQINKNLRDTHGISVYCVLRDVADPSKTFAHVACAEKNIPSSHTIEIGSIGKEKCDYLINFCKNTFIKRIQGIIPELRSTSTPTFMVVGDIQQEDLPTNPKTIIDRFDAISDFDPIPKDIMERMKGKTREILDQDPDSLVLFAKHEQGGPRSGILVRQLSSYFSQ